MYTRPTAIPLAVEFDATSVESVFGCHTVEVKRQQAVVDHRERRLDTWGGRTYGPLIARSAGVKGRFNESVE